MRGGEIHARGLSGLVGFLPAEHAQAPVIARLKSGKAVHRGGRGKIVPLRFREGQEFRRHLRADGMQTDVARACITAAIPIKTGHRFQAAGFERGAQNIFRSTAGPPAHASPEFTD